MADETSQPKPAVIPQGIPLLSHPKQAAPLNKLIGKMLNMKPHGGIKLTSTIHITHGRRAKDRRNRPKFY
jgi:hypothetical protein